MQPKAWPRCLYNKAHRMGDKPKEGLDATTLLENYDLVAITETWWDKLCDWSVTINGYELFRRQKGGRGGGVALYVKRCIECEELPLKNSHEQAEILWVKIRH